LHVPMHGFSCLLVHIFHAIICNSMYLHATTFTCMQLHATVNNGVSTLVEQLSSPVSQFVVLPGYHGKGLQARIIYGTSAELGTVVPNGTME